MGMQYAAGLKVRDSPLLAKLPKTHLYDALDRLDDAKAMADANHLLPDMPRGLGLPRTCPYQPLE